MKFVMRHVLEEVGCRFTPTTSHFDPCFAYDDFGHVVAVLSLINSLTQTSPAAMFEVYEHAKPRFRRKAVSEKY